MSNIQAQTSSDAFAITVQEAGDGIAVYTLLGALVGLTLYGVYCVLFSATIYVMHTRKQTKQLNYMLLTATIAIFVFTSTDVVLQSRRLVIGLIYTPLPYTPDAYFSQEYDWTYVLDEAVIALGGLAADAVLLYRVWIVWGYRWQFVIVNILLWLGLLATDVRTLQVQVATIGNPDDVPLMITLGHWAVITAAFSLAQTVTATGLIALRLWLVDRAASRYKQGSLLPVIRIVVESGAIYALLMLVYVPTLTKGDIAVMVMQWISPTIGITFSLIIVRVGLNLTGDQLGTSGTTAANSHRTQPVNISLGPDVDVEIGGEAEEISRIDGGKESFIMRRRDSVSSNYL